MVTLVPSKTTVCQGEIITFKCSANSNPAVHTYQWYVNETMVNEVRSTGVWNRTMTTGGVFVYKCNVNNTIGTAMSETVTITVNGNNAVFFFLLFLTLSRKSPGLLLQLLANHLSVNGINYKIIKSNYASKTFLEHGAGLRLKRKK